MQLQLVWPLLQGFWLSFALDCHEYRRFGACNDAGLIHPLKVFEAGFDLNTLASFTGKFQVEFVYDNAHMRFGIWHNRLCSAMACYRQRPPSHGRNPLTDLLQVSILL